MVSSSLNGDPGMITHWALAPGVKSLKARYCSCSQELTLDGKGETNLIVRDFEFESDPNWVGGYRFKFKGWVGPALPMSTIYDRTQDFRIVYDPRVAPLDKVIICTADHPNGVEVDVEWDCPKPEPPSKPSTPESSKQVVVPILSIPKPSEIFTLYKMPFPISVAAKLTGTTIKFDPEFFQLQDASINDDGQLVWTLYPIRMGRTQVIVRYTPLNPLEIGNERIFNVRVGVLGPIFPRGDKGSPSEILHFLGGVNIAIREVRSKWPDAELYYVDCTRPPGLVYPVNSATSISQLTAYFRDGNKGTIEITDKGWWSDWDEPIYRPGIILGNKNISWPPGKDTWDLSLEDAVDRLFRAPCVPPTFWSCKFCEPLEPPESGVTQPLYMFLMVDASTWYVGAKDGKVWKASSGQPAVQGGVAA